MIGGGIIGAGCARDLTTRGLRVALVEARDFGHGTTARSTRLIHGGLRYLEQRDFALVRESLRERERLLRNAPHLVQPLLFVTPLYAGGRHNRPLLKVGMTLYDALSYDKSCPATARTTPGASSSWSRASARTGCWAAPLTPTGRWNCRSGCAGERPGDAPGRRRGRQPRPGHGPAARRRPRRRGRGAGRAVGRHLPRARPDHGKHDGPWVEEALGQTSSASRPKKRFLRRTKGVHLVVPKFTDHAVVLVAGTDGRVFFVVPWRGFSVVGTTDTDFQGSLDDVAADADDVAYLQAETRRHFPRADVETVFYTWAGVRALVLERSRQGMSESQVSRKDKIHDHSADGIPGLVTVLGGKITAYRAIAEQMGALAVRLLGRGGPSRTATEPYPGKPLTAPPPDLDRYAAGLRLHLPGLGMEEAHTLVHTHGTAAEEILRLAKEDPALARRVVPDAFEILAQVAWAAREEMATTLGDALLRRTGIGFGPRQGLDGLEEAARVMAGVHGWDEARITAEMDAYRCEIEPMRRFARH